MLPDGVKVGVVTVTYNSEQVLPDFFRSLWAQTHDNFVLYAIDNASADRTLALLRAETDPRLRVIANTINDGVAEGNNVGIANALQNGCECILLLNNDTVFGANLFGNLLAGLARTGAHMVCPKIMCYDEPNRFWAAGGQFQPWLGYRTTHNGGGREDTGQFEEPMSVTYVSTCCVLLQANVFDVVGRMDAQYFVYVDDTDFMYRAHRAGMRMMYVPDARLLHKEGRCTGGPLSPFTIRYITRNRAYFWIKHLGIIQAVAILFAYELYYVVCALTRRDCFRVFCLKQSAFWAGIRMGCKSLLGASSPGIQS